LGILPTTTAAGESLGWVARDLTGLKVGLALGGGGVKGYAHVGVLRALERAGLRFDYLAGTSIGAAVAGLYALGHQPESIPRILDLVGTGLFRPTVSRHGLLSDVGVRSLLEKIGGAERIEDLRLPLGVVAADLGSGREVVFRSGLLWPAVLASIAIPGVYPAQVMGNHTLIDGGVLNPVPTDVAAEMGADIVIGVNLRNRLVLGRDISEARVPAGPKPTMLDVLTRTLELLQSKLAPEEESPSLILLRPDFPDAPGWGLRRFSDGRRYIEVGERATQAALPRIAARLPWLRT
jgi:NTE family protein